MRVESLYEFIVLAHCLNFTAAASKLHTSQPNLSKHIADLEQELGVKLFERGRTLELTAAGIAFHEDAIQIHHLVKDAMVRCRNVAARETETIIVQEPFAHDLTNRIMFRAIAEFKTSNPHVIAKYYSEKKKRSIELLEEGKIDIALTVDCPGSPWIDRMSKKGLTFYPILQENLHVWLWEDHPLASKDLITLEDLSSTPINMTATRTFDPMRYAILGLFERSCGMRPNLQTHSADTLDEFFMNTRDKDSVFLVTPLVADSLSHLQKGMRHLRLNDERAMLISYLVVSDACKKKIVWQFVDLVKRLAQEETHRSSPRPDLTTSPTLCEQPLA